MPLDKLVNQDTAIAVTVQNGRRNSGGGCGLPDASSFSRQMRSWPDVVDAIRTKYCCVSTVARTV